VVVDYVDPFYNPQRRHSTLDEVSPIEYELKHIVLPGLWTKNEIVAVSIIDFFSDLCVTWQPLSVNYHFASSNTNQIQVRSASFVSR
jgi:hypothetical protein